VKLSPHVASPEKCCTRIGTSVTLYSSLAFHNKVGSEAPAGSRDHCSGYIIRRSARLPRRCRLSKIMSELHKYFLSVTYCEYANLDQSIPVRVLRYDSRSVETVESSGLSVLLKVEKRSLKDGLEPRYASTPRNSKIIIRRLFRLHILEMLRYLVVSCLGSSSSEDRTALYSRIHGNRLNQDDIVDQ
jgi:hypothetical protein